MTSTGSLSTSFSVRRAIALAIGIVLIHWLLMRLTQNAPVLRANLNDGFSFVLSLGIAIGLFYISFRYQHIRRIQIAWILLGAAISLVAIGAIIYVVLDAQGTLPYPSISDVFYLSFYPVFAAGLILLSWSSFSPWERLKTFIDIAIAMIAAFLVFWAILIAPTLAAEKNAEPLALAIGIAYPICDWAMIFAILRVLFSSPGDINPASLLVLALAAMGQVIADGIYLTETLAGTYVVGSLVDTIFVGSLALLILMIAFQLIQPPEKNIKPFAAKTAQPQFGWAVFVPHLGAGVAYLLLIWAHKHPFPISFEIMAWTVGGIMGLVFVRQIVVHWENTQLSRQLQAELAERKLAEQTVRKMNEELEQRVIQRTAALTQEIAERKQIEANLEQRVQERTHELEDLSYNIGHDLRSPIRAINAYAGLLLNDLGEQVEAEQRLRLSKIHAVSLRMGRMVDDFLTFLRLGHVEINKRAVNTQALVENVVEKLKFANGGRQIEFSISPLPECLASKDLLENVFSILLSNAIKFSRQCELARIDVGAQEQDGQVCYFVRDNGVGFDMKYAGKLFDVFQRLHREEEFEGVGMGLAIAWRIIQRHGGRIWAEAEVNQGATFFFTLG